MHYFIKGKNSIQMLSSNMLLLRLLWGRTYKIQSGKNWKKYFTSLLNQN